MMITMVVSADEDDDIYNRSRRNTSRKTRKETVMAYDELVSHKIHTRFVTGNF